MQNILVLGGSYFFYGWWDWRFLFLLIGVSALNYLLGIYLEKSENNTRRKVLLFIGLLQGIGGLIVFKYFNFFVTSFIDAFSAININLSIHTIRIILPLGISFYTFRTISYLLDIDRGKIKPCTDWVVFFSYVSFFPSLISGPIDRAGLLIPQLEKKREFKYDQAVDGLRQILWGLFKKIVVADNCAIFTNQVFDGFESLPASSLLLGLFFYTIQIYADFSGYSDMAIGFARLMGFNITKNFDFPFFSQNIAEFWQRWHISLTSWLTDYVFTPLSIHFRDLGNRGLILAIMINFLIIGIWHGANWTFVLFGLLHGAYYIPLILQGKIFKKKKSLKGKLVPSLIELKNMVGVFLMAMVGFVIFRADNISEAFSFYGKLVSLSVFSLPVISNKLGAIVTFLFIIALFIIEWLGKSQEYAIADIGSRFSKPVRWGIYYMLIVTIFFFAATGKEFIYFQF
ncbi:MAG: MBOAT family O-acyltransferase [Bacteroidota bacterium]